MAIFLLSVYNSTLSDERAQLHAIKIDQKHEICKESKPYPCKGDYVGCTTIKLFVI
jgi:hypothetical protein